MSEHLKDSVTDEQHLRTELARLRELVSLNSDWIWEVNAEGKYIYSSPVGSALLGYPQEEIIGRAPADFMLPEDAQTISEIMADKFARRQGFSGLLNRNRRADGTLLVLETSGIPIFSSDGVFKGYRGIDRDVTGLWSRQYQLKAMYDSAPVALYVLDRESRFINANDAMAQLCRLPTDKLVGRLERDFLPLEESSRTPHDFVIVDAGGIVANRELKWSGLTYEVIVKPLKDLEGNIIGLTSALVDITDRIRAERALSEANERLETYADRDYLTGLLNRRALDDLLVREVRNALRERQALTVIMSDLDFFKKYNDRYGHHAGDICLQSVSACLRSVVQRPGDDVARYGGEEFLTILRNTGSQGAQLMAEKMRRAIEELNLPHEDSPFNRVTMSFGVADLDPVAVDKPDLTPWAALLQNADAALYAAKAAGRNIVHAQ